MNACCGGRGRYGLGLNFCATNEAMAGRQKNERKRVDVRRKSSRNEQVTSGICWGVQVGEFLRDAPDLVSFLDYLSWSNTYTPDHLPLVTHT